MIQNTPPPAMESKPIAIIQRETWLRGFAYALFVFATFTLAGMELAVILLHLLVLYHRLRAPVTEWLPWWVVTPFLLLGISAIFSALINPHTASALAELRGEYRLFLPFVLLPALALVDTRRLLMAHLAAVALISLFSLAQFGFGWHPFRPHLAGLRFATGGFGMYLTLGGVMLISLPVFASLALSEESRWRWLWAGGAALALLTVVVSISRSAWLGAVVALGILLLRLPRRLAVVLVAAGCVVALAGAGLVASGWLEGKTGGGSAQILLNRITRTAQGTDSERLVLWRAALRGIADAPLFGHGMADEAYDAYRDEQMREEHITRMSAPNARPHNQYLRVFFGLGAMGLAVFLWLWGAVLAWSAVWIHRAAGVFPFEAALLWGIIAGLAGSMVSGIFVGQFFDAEVQINILMWMGLAIHTGLVLRHRLEREQLIAG